MDSRSTGGASSAGGTRCAGDALDSRSTGGASSAGGTRCAGDALDSRGTGGASSAGGTRSPGGPGCAPQSRHAGGSLRTGCTGSAGGAGRSGGAGGAGSSAGAGHSSAAGRASGTGSAGGAGGTGISHQAAGTHGAGGTLGTGGACSAGGAGGSGSSRVSGGTGGAGGANPSGGAGGSGIARKPGRSGCAGSAGGTGGAACRAGGSGTAGVARQPGIAGCAGHSGVTGGAGSAGRTGRPLAGAGTIRGITAGTRGTPAGLVVGSINGHVITSHPVQRWFIPILCGGKPGCPPPRPWLQNRKRPSHGNQGTAFSEEENNLCIERIARKKKNFFGNRQTFGKEGSPLAARSLQRRLPRDCPVSQVLSPTDNLIISRKLLQIKRKNQMFCEHFVNRPFGAAKLPRRKKRPRPPAGAPIDFSR